MAQRINESANADFVRLDLEIRGMQRQMRFKHLVCSSAAGCFLRIYTLKAAAISIFAEPKARSSPMFLTPLVVRSFLSL